jgi:hypothetical protein
MIAPQHRALIADLGRRDLARDGEAKDRLLRQRELLAPQKHIFEPQPMGQAVKPAAIGEMGHRLLAATQPSIALEVTWTLPKMLTWEISPMRTSAYFRGPGRAILARYICLPQSDFGPIARPEAVNPLDQLKLGTR